MRWLKHMTATRDDEKVASLIDRLGYEGYGMWWAVLETIAGSMEKGSEKCSLSYPISKWAANLQLSPQNVRRQLAALCAEGLLEIHCEYAAIELTAPNLLKYRDEYSKKSGHSQETVRSKKQKQNIETETEAEQVPFLPPPKQPRMSQPGWSPDWDRVQSEYPGLIAPDLDCQRFISRVENAENEAVFFENLAAWKNGDQFQRGKVFSLKNFLDGGYWKTKPTGKPGDEGPGYMTLEDHKRQLDEQRKHRQSASETV